MRINEVLDVRAIGISNWAYDNKAKKRYSIQFYDYDYNGSKHIPQSHVNMIMDLFPYDCIMFETKHGVHFVSFALLKGLNITKARTLETTKNMGKAQDYWTSQKDLTLRVSEKWKVRKILGYKIVSERPTFKGLAKYPNQYRISNQHLTFYKKYLGLPDWVFKLYDDCDKYNYRIKIYHYKTRI